MHLLVTDAASAYEEPGADAQKHKEQQLMQHYIPSSQPCQQQESAYVPYDIRQKRQQVSLDEPDDEDFSIPSSLQSQEHMSLGGSRQQQQRELHEHRQQQLQQQREQQQQQEIQHEQRMQQHEQREQQLQQKRTQGQQHLTQQHEHRQLQQHEQWQQTAQQGSSRGYGVDGQAEQQQHQLRNSIPSRQLLEEQLRGPGRSTAQRQQQQHRGVGWAVQQEEEEEEERWEAERGYMRQVTARQAQLREPEPQGNKARSLGSAVEQQRQQRHVPQHHQQQQQWGSGNQRQDMAKPKPSSGNLQQSYRGRASTGGGSRKPMNCDAVASAPRNISRAQGAQGQHSDAATAAVMHRPIPAPRAGSDQGETGALRLSTSPNRHSRSAAVERALAEQMQREQQWQPGGAGKGQRQCLPESYPANREQRLAQLAQPRSLKKEKYEQVWVRFGVRMVVFPRCLACHLYTQCASWTRKQI